MIIKIPLNKTQNKTHDKSKYELNVVQKRNSIKFHKTQIFLKYQNDFVNVQKIKQRQIYYTNNQSISSKSNKKQIQELKKKIPLLKSNFLLDKEEEYKTQQLLNNEKNKLQNKMHTNQIFNHKIANYQFDKHNQKRKKNNQSFNFYDPLQISIIPKEDKQARTICIEVENKLPKLNVRYKEFEEKRQHNKNKQKSQQMQKSDRNYFNLSSLYSKTWALY